MRPKAKALGYEMVQALQRHTPGAKAPLVEPMRPKAKALGYEMVQALQKHTQGLKPHFPVEPMRPKAKSLRVRDGAGAAKAYPRG
jgi:hypothetical protein